MSTSGASRRPRASVARCAIAIFASVSAAIGQDPPHETPAAAATTRPKAAPEKPLPVVPRPELPPRPSTTLEIAPFEPLPPELLAKHVAELLPLVEEHFGRAFLSPPEVCAADERSWIALVEAEHLAARDRARTVATTFALYLPEREDVVLSPFIAHMLVGDDEDRRRFAQATLAHELVHVLQDQHFALPARMRVEADFWRKQVLRSLQEGHATLIEERIATSLGAADAERAIRRRHRRGSGVVYLRGRDYLASIEAENGRDAVLEALCGDLPSPLEFARRSAPKRGSDGPDDRRPGRR